MSKRILIIDDDNDFVDAVTNLLEAKNYEIITASNGKEGFESAKKNKPDLILLDVMMTKKTEGFDTARSLSSDESTKKIPIIMVSGIRKEMNVPFSIEPNEEWLPVKAFIEKPIKPNELLQKVEEVLK
ncbi:MAG TPA: response regulator [bacterium]|nr:response regulator [bacterium]HOL48292.1 response regulator [bacterium]HPQ19381.1 response regulator [bacterium]